MDIEKVYINQKISYLKCSDSPLSSDVGMILDDGKLWLFDVGNNEDCINKLNECDSVILSHFHLDHIGNLQKLDKKQIYVSKETYKHTHFGNIVTDDLYFGNLHIFPIPSSHAKGCLGLEVDETYAFVGDALYSKITKEQLIYNAQLLKEEIDVLKKLKASYLLVSHDSKFIYSKEEWIEKLEKIYNKRDIGNPYIQYEEENENE